MTARSNRIFAAALFLVAPAIASGAPADPAPPASPEAPIPESSWQPSLNGKGMAVFEPAGVGVDAAQCAAIGDLLRTELTKLGVAVTPRSKMPEASCADESCAAALAGPLLVNEAVVTRISRLDKKVMVISTIIEVPSGKTVFSDRMTAASLDDFDVLAVRIARGLVGRVPFATTGDVDSISAQDARDPTRQKSFLTSGLRLGGIAPLGGSYARASSLYRGEVISLYEVRSFVIEAAAGFSANSQYSSDSETRLVETGIDLGGYYHFDKADISPFMGGGLGIHSLAGEFTDPGPTKSPDDDQRIRVNTNGPAFWVGGGATLFRASDVHLVLTGRYTMTMVEILDQPVYGLMVGIGVTYTRKNTVCCLW